MDIWRHLPPLAALRAFCAWAETGSMTAAGVALNVSHAAISQQIRALEAHLGLALIERGTGTAQLTEDGARLADALRSGFGEMARVVAELTGAEAGRPLLGHHHAKLCCGLAAAAPAALSGGPSGRRTAA